MNSCCLLVAMRCCPSGDQVAADRGYSSFDRTPYPSLCAADGPTNPHILQIGCIFVELLTGLFICSPLVCDSMVHIPPIAVLRAVIWGNDWRCQHSVEGDIYVHGFVFTDCLPLLVIFSTSLNIPYTIAKSGRAKGRRTMPG